MSNWKPVCAASDVAENTLKRVTVDGLDLVVANHGKGVRVFPPFCPHMHEPLDQSGMLSDGLLTCGKHLWQWNLITGEKAGLSEKDILLYDVEEEDGKIFANLEKELVYEWEEEDEMDDDDFFGSD